jgi:hypothetical protein
MRDSCRLALSNGLSAEQVSILEKLVNSIRPGSDPLTSLKQCDPFLKELIQAQPPYIPKTESRYESLMKLQNWMVKNCPESGAGTTWEFSIHGNSVCALQDIGKG